MPRPSSEEAADGGDRRDFFISYASADRAWAEWVCWHLQDAGYTVELDVHDWAPGEHFVANMNRAITRAQRVVALLSDAYFASPWASEEFDAAVNQEKTLQRPVLLPIRIDTCSLPPLASTRIYADLVGLRRREALEHLLAAARGRQTASASGLFRRRSAPPLPTRSGRPPRIPDRPTALAGMEPALPAQPTVWRMRGQLRNPHFVGRDRLLADLRGQLHTSHQVLLQALHGMGGVGKTATAVEYAYRYAADYDLVCWLPADQPALLAGHLLTLAKALDTSGRNGDGLDLDDVLGLLRSRRRTLLIFDNAEQPADLRPYLPGGICHVLITSRRRGWDQIGSQLEVEVFTRPETVALLRHRLPGIDPAVAEQLAEELGDLPLAVAQAAAYIHRTATPPATYLQLFRDRHRSLLERYEPADYPATLATTWTLTLTQLAGQHPAAAQLLTLAAFFAPDPISQELFTAHPQLLDDPLRSTAADAGLVNDTVGVLADYALVDRLANHRLQVHRMLQAAIRHAIPDQERQTLRRTVATLLAAAAPQFPDHPATWPTYQLLLPHILGTDLADQITDPTIRRLFINTCNYLDSRGETKILRAVCSLVHDSYQHHLGADHRDTLGSAKQLASVLRQLGELAEARALFEDILARRRRLLGDDHPLTLAAVSSLGNLLKDLGELAQARALYEDTLARYQRLVAADSPGALDLANNLALLLRDLGELAQARALFEHALAGYRRLVGDDYPNALAIATNLALLLCDLGELPDARALFEDTLARCQRLLGDDHPLTLEAARGLASTQRTDGAHPEARAVLEDTLARYRRLLGDDHPNTLASANHLALLLHGSGELAQARTLHEDTLARYRRLLGDDHPSTLVSANNLANVLKDLSEPRAARTLHEDTLARRRRLLGDDHPETLSSANNVASLLLAAWKLPEARALFEDTLARYRRLLGNDHVNTLISAFNLALVLHALGNHEAAVDLYRETRESQIRVLGPNHPNTVKTGRWLNLALEKLGRPPAAQLATPTSEKTDSQK